MPPIAASPRLSRRSSTAPDRAPAAADCGLLPFAAPYCGCCCGLSEPLQYMHGIVRDWDGLGWTRRNGAPKASGLSEAPSAGAVLRRLPPPQRTGGALGVRCSPRKCESVGDGGESWAPAPSTPPCAASPHLNTPGRAIPSPHPAQPPPPSPPPSPPTPAHLLVIPLVGPAPCGGGGGGGLLRLSAAAGCGIVRRAAAAPVAPLIAALVAALVLRGVLRRMLRRVLRRVLRRLFCGARCGACFAGRR